MFSLVCFYAHRLRFILTYILFEIKYYILGGIAIAEDLITRSKNKCEFISKSGEVAVVTGGARGIGLELVKKLLQCDMHVIIGCRSVESGLQAVSKIRESGVTAGSTSVYKLDLCSFNSIKDFAQTVQEKHPFINLLVNNAGIMFVPYAEMEGFESQWTVNYMGPFLLTHLLLPLLEKAPGPNRARVVNVSSCAHFAASSLNINGVYSKYDFITSDCYAQSKLAQILFTRELNNKLTQRGSNVISLAVHPGIVDTDIFNGTILKILFPWVLKYLCKTSDEGATTLLHTCISPKLESKGGSYLSNCRVKRPSGLAENEPLQKDLFNHSLLKLNIEAF